MSEIEKMKRYIERTKIDPSVSATYSLNLAEALDLAHQASSKGNIPVEAISLAFDYGMAKGYRAAKAKMKEAIT